MLTLKQKIFEYFAHYETRRKEPYFQDFSSHDIIYYNTMLQDLLNTPTGYKFINILYNEVDVSYAITRLSKALFEYQDIKPFTANGNINESGQEMSQDVHTIMRATVEHHLKEAFKAMKVDLNDINITENLEEGNIGTPGRLAKMWCGANLEDTTELLSGRWNKPPRMASFDTESVNQSPVWVKTQIRAVCSHHVIGFHNFPNSEESFVVVGYIPKNGVKGGISKVSRFVNYLARRMWLQEDLTDRIGEVIMDKFKTDDVYVALVNINHGCSWTRGANDTDATTSTFFASGKFTEHIELIPDNFKGM